MGLSISYNVKAPAGWSRKTIKVKLEEARQFASSLPVLSVSDLAEFQGDQVESQHGSKDPFFWAKTQAARPIPSPFDPDVYGSQAPSRMVVFSVLPTKGCEPMNVGICDYPEHVWPAEPDEEADGASPAGDKRITPAAKGVWCSACKTQYANDPRLGGWSNFVKAHLSVLAILEKLRALGFEVTVEDEGGFWEGRDLGKLAEALRHYDAMVAGFTGAIRDAAGKNSIVIKSAMSGRPDFEKLELEGQEGLGDVLRKLREDGLI